MPERVDELPELELDDVVEGPRPVHRGLISEETERELRAAAEDLARGAHVDTTMDVSLEMDAPPVFPGSFASEPAPAVHQPLTSAPSDAALEALLTTIDAPNELHDAVQGLNPDDLAAHLPPVVVPQGDPLAPHLPLSMEEPPAVSRIPMEQLMPDPKALEALQRLAGAAGHPDRTRKAMTQAFTGAAYDPRHLPDARVMMVGIARVLAAHGLPVEEMVDAIMQNLTD